MSELIVGLIVLVLGLAVCFFGLRVFFVMLPIWGFVAGFFLGALAVTGLFGDGFLSTVLGWVVGIVVGIVFAVLSYFVWYAGAIIAAGSFGALLGSGLMAALGVETGFVHWLVAAIGAVVVAVLAAVLLLPVYMVVVNTAFAGAAGAIAGVLLVFQQIRLDGLGEGVAIATIRASWFWVLVWVVLAAGGILFQLRDVAAVTLPEERWTRAQAAA